MSKLHHVIANLSHAAIHSGGRSLAPVSAQVLMNYFAKVQKGATTMTKAVDTLCMPSAPGAAALLNGVSKERARSILRALIGEGYLRYRFITKKEGNMPIIVPLISFVRPLQGSFVMRAAAPPYVPGALRLRHVLMTAPTRVLTASYARCPVHGFATDATQHPEKRWQESETACWTPRTLCWRATTASPVKNGSSSKCRAQRRRCRAAAATTPCFRAGVT